MSRRILVCLLAAAVLAAAQPASSSFADEQLRQRLVAQGIQYLSAAQADDGSFSAAAGPAVTSLVASSLLRNGRTLQDPVVAKAVAYVRQFVQTDGGIYQSGSLYRNYETCVSLQCLHLANADSRFDKQITRAKAFLRGIQWDTGEDIERDDFAYGGAGYGKHKRPDLSNTSFFVETLSEVATSAEDKAAIEAALVFVSRCQNLESEHNQTPFSAKNPDGGFYYTPAAGGTSQAGSTDAGGLRSYASMTYAGLKSMIYAGLAPDDPRVEAAVKWIQKHYDLSSNPGLGDAGLYYYYHTFAKALDAMKVEKLAAAQGGQHDWRADLISELAKRHQADGSWSNSNERWLEGDANLVTAYALLALSYARQ